MPWDEPETLPAAPITDTVLLLQRDFAYAMTHTAILVHSSHDELRMLVNTARGQIVPAGECRLSDGSVLEFQDIGMPQINAPAMSVPDLVAEIWRRVAAMGLTVAP